MGRWRILLCRDLDRTRLDLPSDLHVGFLEDRFSSVVKRGGGTERTSESINDFNLINRVHRRR